ncbi:sensor histidine kinase [Pseudonocardia sp. KRD-184]|uniref:histidine kinase n=1 Tax=Pseudonocardia oceani TaxID=2792013 RepID=A0ABS6UEG1_9PSEU|nr:ATP-binding protein [Pseudonocardia oceani]MBW0092235.1 sensor histidine kinase [Pseudonocardia oceani]MBW0099226.1 sensor histidine kinase [Pseudonocardia oceani]MBW0111742.1 sensor histidine kinase [Pseudonocardia oceani]MBW0130632.1 sensor histidine kinase [Pseudonocardia oceani]
MIPPLQVALAQLAAVWVAGVAIVVALVREGPLGGVALAYGFPLVAALYAGAGLLAWWRRPANRLGPLLVVGGAAFLCVSLANTDVPALIAVGTVTATVPVAVVVHLLHTFPGGRLRGRASTAAVLAIYVVALVLQIPIWAFTPEPPPFDVVLVSPRPDLAAAGAYVQQVCGAVVVLVTVGLLVRRLSEYGLGQRRVLAPVLAYGVLAVLAIPLGGRLLRQLGLGDDAVWIQLGLLAGVPVVFAAVVLRGGFAPTRELSAFVTSVTSSSGSRDELEQAVATTLGDPSATLLHRSPDHSGYLDTTGTVVALPALDEDRAAVSIAVGDRPVGAVVYDSRLNDDSEAVAAVGRVAAIALDRQRLADEVSESRRALREASSRLLSAADRERRRIARDLHDGLQVSLVRLSMQAHQLAQEPLGAESPAVVARMAADVDEAAAALRGLVNGVMPAPLVERGLAAAVQELAHNLPVRIQLDVDGVPARLPAPVESTAYFVVAEALTNVIKHAGARNVAVSLRTDGSALVIEVVDDGRGGTSEGGSGSGLRGLRDRLDVLGGTLTVADGAPGTRLRATLPCA